MSAPVGSVRQAALRGVAWAFGATAASKLAWMAGLAVLARLLAPEHFGLFAFALVFIAYVETLGDLGTSAALIHWPERTEEAAQVAFWANLATGLLWFGLTQLAAPAVAAFFQSPEGEPILRVLALSFLIKALGNTHDALCRKALRFRARLLPESSLALSKALVAVALAWAGLGAWSLVWAQLAGLTLQTATLWLIVPWRPRVRLRVARDLVVPMMRYGGGIVGVNVLAAVVHHADLVVVGRMLGAGALGIYQIAAKLPEATIAIGIWTVSLVLFPAFSRFHAAGAGLAEAYLTALRYVSLVTLPAAAVLIVAAEPLVLVLFGQRWAPGIPVLQALAAYAGLRSLGSHAGDVLKATGRTHLLAGLAAVKAILLLPALIAAARWGAPAVAASLAAVTGLTAALMVGVVARLIRIPPRRVLAAVAPALRTTALTVLPVLAWTTWGPQVPAPAGLAALLALGVGTYLMALHRVEPALLRGARESLRGRRKAREGLRMRAPVRETLAAGGAGQALPATGVWEDPPATGTREAPATREAAAASGTREALLAPEPAAGRGGE